MFKSINVETTVNRELSLVWDLWTKPEHVMKWLHASYDWECPNAENDLKAGGRFVFTMSAKDKSDSFDFSGTYSIVEINKVIAYILDDNRKVSVFFYQLNTGIRIVENFELENINPEDKQRVGWQAILNNFKIYAEGYRG